MKAKTVAACLLALMLVPASFSFEAPIPVPAQAMVWAASAGGDCILTCYDNPIGMGCTGGEDLHVAKQEGDTHLYSGGWHDTCWAGTCDDKHAPCLVMASALNDLRDDILAQAPRARFVSLAHRYRDVLQLEQDALFINDCDGHLVAMIPLGVLASE
jgi:hypothetical protein